MYKVFLSSTSKDLAAYREAVHRAIDGLPGFQLVKMEDFGARNANARDLCARLVRECDLFVGLVGHYYGSCPPNDITSFTELEYRTATAANLARLMFVAPDDFPVPASLRESDASFERQQAFRREVMTDLVVDAFDTPEKLASAVTRALFVWHEERRAAEARSREAEQQAERRRARIQRSLYLASTFIFLVSTPLLLGFFYFLTAPFMERQSVETIEADINGLAEHYREAGLDRLREVIARRSDAQPNRAIVYLLTDHLGQPVAGNLDQWPDVEPDPDGWITFSIDVGADRVTVEQRRALAQAFTVANNSFLLIGLEVEDRLQIQMLMIQAIVWSLALALLIALLVAFGGRWLLALKSKADRSRPSMNGTEVKLGARRGQRDADSAPGDRGWSYGGGVQPAAKTPRGRRL